MKIGILGSGHIGGTLGELLGRAGHDIRFGHRSETDSIEAAIQHGEAVIYAGYFAGWPDLARDHAATFAGKVVIDAANPVRERDGTIVDEVAAAGGGAGSYVQALLPGAHVVKAFNTLYWEVLRDGGGPGTALPISGQGRAAEIAVALVRDAGFEPVLIGPLAGSARQDPDGPVYNRALDAEALRAALA